MSRQRTATEALREGREALDEWRSIHTDSICGIHGADLTFVNLRNANLSHMNLQGANLSKANLEQADLTHANLSSCNLSGANLRGVQAVHCNFSQALLDEVDLSEANLAYSNLAESSLLSAKLQGARLIKANLREARLHHAEFSGSILSGTGLSGLDFESANGLQSVIHVGPSSIGSDTLANSKGLIPLDFLRGCGLMEWEIENAKLYKANLTPHEVSDIQYRVHELISDPPLINTPVFISYVHPDSEFVDKIEKHLDEKNIRFWRDTHDLKAGPADKQVKRVFETLEPVVLLVLSKHSVTSKWVEWEAHEAQELEKRINRSVILPIALDDSWVHSDWPGPLKYCIEKHSIMDFSKWRDPLSFSQSLSNLFRGLQNNYGVGDN